MSIRAGTGMGRGLDPAQASREAAAAAATARGGEAPARAIVYARPRYEQVNTPLDAVPEVAQTTLTRQRVRGTRMATTLTTLAL